MIITYHDIFMVYQIMDRNKTVKFGACKCKSPEVEIFGLVQEKKFILKKQPLKICIVTKIYRNK